MGSRLVRTLRREWGKVARTGANGPIEEGPKSTVESGETVYIRSGRSDGVAGEVVVEDGVVRFGAGIRSLRGGVLND